jgi:hypothetical protein
VKSFILVLLSALAIGYYLTAKANSGTSINSTDVEKYSDIFFKLETSPVSMREIIVGAKHFAITLCEDGGYQQALGGSVSACKLNFDRTKDMCSRYPVAEKEQFYTDKAIVSLLAEQFINCVSS